MTLAVNDINCAVYVFKKYDDFAMKILNVTFTTGKGGLEQAFLDYNTCLQMEHHEVAGLLHPSSYLKDLIKSPYHTVKNHSKYDPIALFRISRIISKEKPDIIITHGNRAHYMAVTATKLCSNKPIIVGICHGYSFDYITKCDHIISVGIGMQKALIELGYPATQVHHIPNMIHIDEQSSITRQNRKPKVVGFIGRIDKSKGVDLLVSALSNIKKIGVQLQAIIAGHGSEQQNIESLIQSRGLQSDINMTGWVTDKTKFFSDIDILCVPSRSEPFGIVILEAFKHHTPVIASNVSGPLEIITPNHDGLIFESENIEDLSASITKLIQDPKLARDLATNGYQTALKYDIKNVSKQLNETLIQILHS